MEKCASGDVLMSKGDRLNKKQSTKNVVEKENMLSKPYARLVGSLMYAQVYTRPDLSFCCWDFIKISVKPGS